MYKPIPFSKVNIDDNFWNYKQEINRSVTIPASYKQNLETGRIDAFKLNWNKGDRPIPHKFWDSDVAKWVETACYSLHTHLDPELEKTMESLVDLICSAQQEDGYLNTHYTIVEPELRWKNLQYNHELYCAGHLMEAAVAHYRTTGKTKFLDVMCKYADYIDTIFGEEEEKIHGYPGHEEIELALVKLYRVTGNEKYLKLSKYFIDERGQLPHHFMIEDMNEGKTIDSDVFKAIGKYAVFQAHVPPVEQEEVEGHAVRAGYLYSGMADLAAEMNDEELKEACHTLWEDGVLTKMYITGGIGSNHKHESVGNSYQLPNEMAYCETCAAIALLFWNHRMLQLELDGKYADVVEKILYNGSISGVSLDGKKFFYQNPLAITSNRRGFQRKQWYRTSCCPNNLSRLIASLGSYIYGIDEAESSIAIHQFITSEVNAQIADSNIKIKQDSQFPWDGQINFSFELPKEMDFSLKIRIPSWSENFTLRVNREKQDIVPVKGYVELMRKWNTRDSVELNLDMSVKRMYAHPQVSADVGRVALQKGPIVFCFEEIDNGADIDNIIIPKNAELKATFNKDFLNGVMVIAGKGMKMSPSTWDKTLYQTTNISLENIEFKAVPYYAWNNRGVGEMAVWIRELWEK